MPLSFIEKIEPAGHFTQRLNLSRADIRLLERGPNDEYVERTI